MLVKHETDNYRLTSRRLGFCMLVRKADGASAFFQDDDAALWERNLSALQSIKSWSENDSLDKSFDLICEGYDEILGHAPK